MSVPTSDLAPIGALRRRVATFVAGRDLLRAGERPLLLLSGGADSMALLDLVRWLDGELGLGLTLLALHVDYRTRGTASDRDRLLVLHACEAAGVPLETVRLPRKPEGPDFQERARRLRYAAAADVVAGGRADVVVTGHNRDDQAETVLYRLAKYASPSSLVGMRPRAAGVARPLLCLGAEEIRAYCVAAEIDYGVDESNAGLAYARNRVRHEVLPALARINPSVAITLADCAEVAALERSVLSGVVDEAWKQVSLPAAEGELVALDVLALTAQTEAVRSLCLRRFLHEATGPEALVDRRTTAAVERLAGSTRGSARVALGRGLEARREYARLAVGRRAGRHACPPAALSPPASAEFCGRRFCAALIEGPHFSRDQREAWLAVERPDAAVVLRHPRRGDRFRPLGMDESLLVSGFLSAAKVPRAARARVVVAEMGGQIVWVSPGRISESYRVSAVTRYTLHIREEES